MVGNDKHDSGNDEPIRPELPSKYRRSDCIETFSKVYNYGSMASNLAPLREAHLGLHISSVYFKLGRIPTRLLGARNCYVCRH
mmetsp:Transcript_20572/g.30929  ORF Transcript_20572/g.30929 Transcript_20572/m.30929 type:complete len:83 (-) Transcript_20572:395-643(-)